MYGHVNQVLTTTDHPTEQVTCSRDALCDANEIVRDFIAIFMFYDIQAIMYTRYCMIIRFLIDLLMYEMRGGCGVL